MRVLLIYPVFPQSFWSFEKVIALVGRKALMPPLGLITVAAILPQTWEFKLVDRNVSEITEAEWDWAELVIISAMIVQKPDFLAQVQEAKRRGKSVAVGGPYPTTSPEEVEAMGVDYLVLDEGEITLPLFVSALEKGEKSGIFRSDGVKPDVTTTPIPRYDLLQLNVYDSMSIQFSRGCPFQCEFCDIIVLYGRKPRTKTPSQLIQELECLYELGWRDPLFLVDDNFIGNKRNVKLLLNELKEWMAEKDYPFNFTTEASVDLAQDPELMDLMVDCNFTVVFLGLETPDEASLIQTKKFQNTRDSLTDLVDKITEKGLRVMAGFIMGFDNEKPGAGERIVEFVEQTAIPTALFSMLQALPNTALWHRLEKENRLMNSDANINQTTLMNFVPTRPLEQITKEYIDGFWQLYDPNTYLDRTFRYFQKLGEPKHFGKKEFHWVRVRALFIVLWRQGVLRETRGKFWNYLFFMLRNKPRLFSSFMTVCAHFEHFVEYRQIVRDQISDQLAAYLEHSEPTEPPAKLAVH
ncbi:MAG: B12-binding domain-containing radical SAM protein [Microcoleaceae cyanobacterium]